MTGGKVVSGETDLSILFKGLRATLRDGVYVFVCLGNAELPTGCKPLMVFQEAEGTTLILLKEKATHFELKYEFPCRMITLNVHSSLEAVGFIARIAAALAQENIGANPVSGFFHDHLFVPQGRESDALRIINGLST